MQTKLQELTEKIYQEGVLKAKEEAESILASAKNEAESLVAKAHKEAEEIQNKALREAEEMKKNSLNELQLSARQMISDLKLNVVSLIEAKTIRPEAEKALKDTAFTAGVIQTIVKNWNPSSGDPVALELVLPEKARKEFESYFSGKAAQELGKGVELSYSERIKGGFKIGPKDGGYLVSFTDSDFEHLFQSYLRPRLIELLFSTSK